MSRPRPDFGFGVDVFALARERGIRIIEEDTAGENLRGAAFRKGEAWYILVNKEDPFERKCFTVAHELAEIELDPRDDLSLDEKHRRANIRAGEILLPEDIFKNVVFSATLPELKAMFPACSFEVIARRIVRFRPGVLTIFDNGELTVRLAGEGMSYPSWPAPFEMEIIKACYEKKCDIVFNDNNLDRFAYYIDLNGRVQRVILFVFPTDDFF